MDRKTILRGAVKMVYYLIKPNADLQNLLKQNPDVSVSPTLFQIDESGYPIMTLSETLESHKLFHLAWLDNYIQIPIIDSLSHILSEQTQHRQREFYQTLLGNPPYTRQHFDRWWTIERIGIKLDYNWALEHISLSSIEALQENDSSRIAIWVKSLIDWKKKQESQE